MKLPIKLILKYSGIGLLLAVAVYASKKGLDVNSGSLLFVAVCFIISSFFWK